MARRRSNHGKAMAVAGVLAPTRGSLRYSRPAMRRKRHEPPHRHRRGRARHPRQLRGRAARARATRSRPTPTARARSPRFARACPTSRSIDIGLADDIDGGFALCRELRALSASAADHLPVGARLRLRHRRRAAPGRRRLPHQGREPAAPRRAHRRAVPPQRPARRRRRRSRTSLERGPLRST